jgi:hypothetical protein
VFQRLTQALRKRARRPLPARVTIQVGLQEFLERTVLAEIRTGRSEDSWATLRQIGVADTVEVRQLLHQLKTAHLQLQQLQTEMQSVERAAKRGPAALRLVRRYVQAEKGHADCLTRISAWLVGEEMVSELPPGAA